MVISHFLNDLEIEEPIGFAELEISMRRDERFHGMQFEASLSTLEFYGIAYDYLVQQKSLYGLKSTVVYRAIIACDEDTPEEEIYRGRLNFGKWKDECGITCRVSMPAEEDNCRVIFKARFDQKVDIDSIIAFDKTTGLPSYAWLGVQMEIPAKALEVGTAGIVAAGSNAVNTSFITLGPSEWIARPTYEVIQDESLLTSQLIPFSDQERHNDEFAQPITPQLLLEDTSNCLPGTLSYEFRHVGSFLLESENSILVEYIKLKVVTWDAIGNIFDDSVLIEEITLVPAGAVGTYFFGSFDELMSGTVNLEDGHGLYSFIEFSAGTFLGDVDYNVTFAPQTSVNISATKLCPATTAQVYLVHEAMSRVSEAITNRCLRARSDYYGRIDSQPFAAAQDGCGGLRLLTSGLKLRKAPDGKDKFFISIKDILEGLCAIDNIGFSIDPDDTIPGYYVLRVEDVSYFYRNNELLSLNSIPVASSEVLENGHYARILIGYKKWEVEEVNGLGEPNSNREYRTSLETISNTLDQTSVLVAGSYPIEITRQQTFAKTGAADTSYDNETFIICVDRDAYSFHVEQGNISSPANIFDPATLLNYRITPVRNLMRWAKSIFNSYANFSSSANKLFFNAGTGNITAQGMLSDDFCRMENTVLAENQDISVNSFANASDYTPLWRPETVTFDYPLSVGEYQILKANPYGVISYQCGNGDFAQAFIKEIKFQPMKGKTTFTLIKKW